MASRPLLEPVRHNAGRGLPKTVAHEQKPTTHLTNKTGILLVLARRNVLHSTVGRKIQSGEFSAALCHRKAVSRGVPKSYVRLLPKNCPISRRLVAYRVGCFNIELRIIGPVGGNDIENRNNKCATTFYASRFQYHLSGGIGGAAHRACRGT